jgi:hypothetical protein
LQLKNKEQSNNQTKPSSFKANESQEMSQSQKIDVSLLSRNVPSLCIPRVFLNITKYRIFKSFKDINIGFIDKIETIICTDKAGQKYHRVFVHLQWNNAPHTIQMRQRVLEGKDVKIVYDEPWFWKVSANRAQQKERTTLYAKERDADEESDMEEQMRAKKADNDRRKKQREEELKRDEIVDVDDSSP